MTRKVKYALPKGERALFTVEILRRYRREEISYSAAVCWLRFDYRSDWKKGVTHKVRTADLAKACNLSRSAAHRGVKELKEKGLIRQRTESGCSDGHVYDLWPFDASERKARVIGTVPNHNAGLGPFELLASGEIDGYALIDFLNKSLEWNLHGGYTPPRSMSFWAWTSGICRSKLYDTKAQLILAGLLVQKSVKTFISKFLLFPFIEQESRSARESASASRSREREREPEPDPSQVVYRDGKYHYGGKRYRESGMGYWEVWRSARVSGISGRWITCPEVRVPAEILSYKESL